MMTVLAALAVIVLGYLAYAVDTHLARIAKELQAMRIDNAHWRNNVWKRDAD